MPILKRIDSYRRSTGRADHRPLLAFLRRVTPLLEPSFSPPHAVVLHEEQPETAREIGKTTLRLGDGEHGFEAVYMVVHHPHWGYRAVDQVVVSVYGLPEAHALSILDAEGIDLGGRQYAYIELKAEGPEEAAKAVIEAFEAAFGSVEQV